MAIKSIAAAARELGYRSRSSLQNLMDDGYLDDFISLNERGHRQLEMNGLRERVTQVVNWSDRNVVAKERLGLLYPLAGRAALGPTRWMWAPGVRVVALCVSP